MITQTSCSRPGCPARRRAGLGAALFLAAALTAGGAAAQTPAAAPAADPVVAKVDGTEIRQSDLALAEEDVGANIPAGTPDAKRDWLINYLTDMTLLAKAAEAKKIPDTADFKSRLAYVRSKALMETLLRDSGKAGATTDAMQHVYQEAVKQMGEEQEVHARHILFRVADANDQKAAAAAEAKAKDTLAKIKKGEDFAKLAKDLTEDPAGKADGGDLGWFTKDQMVPEFSEAAFKLDKGQVSDPVKTSFGWHLIKLEDKRKREAPPFDQVKDQIETFVTRKAQIELLNKLRQDAKIERLDKPEASPAPAPAPSATPNAAPAKK
ncbi:peptidyl-prolyl cis-trans isomerase [Rhodoplanes sp. TEM]|uniref:Parvulin-like PPIase n=1 Tax=Rhodoplanes tepidamans TaxID=200616 RepID=A0ABT5J4I6_RHOTP|nr:MULTISPECIES: peptidylprolyl isomerase [Rhodoplanes]MDC7784545.1 peptidyl-prolyl cis-trans isomerase [Rhodoplanes tepidamans]MDC7984452.1 peptidyl-prolyl cis-trans isomerase [Rhodoplanes sp. TEM]MDQ0355773.1 peptidyl-prolyl cis-trans isomerase C [Rhodoplanes tepidamans]